MDKLAYEPTIGGVLLRDTGGGAVWGSDAMFRAARRLDKRKLVVASMGSMAASGGYWTALGARTIFANPGTITGSIGIWMAKPDFSGLLRRLNVGVDRVSAGPWPYAMSLKSGWSAAERAVLRRSLQRYYRLFLSRVSKRRKLSMKAVAPLAGGRLWLGSEARGHRLVDRVGGFIDAFDEVVRDNDAPEPPEVLFLPRRSLTAKIRAALTGAQTSDVKALSALAGPWLDRAAALAALPRGAPLAISPVAAPRPAP